MRSNASTAVVCLPLLGAAECDALLERLAGADWQEARVATPAGGATAVPELRRAAVVEVGDDPCLGRAVAFAEQVNRGLYEFDLRGLAGTDPPLAMRYREGDHFDWHIDNGTEAVGTRKLSFTVQLSDPDAYDGGDLELAMYAGAYGGAFAEQARQLRRRGAITLFPAFHLHRVSPVTRGERVALVGWLHGPRFR